MPWRAGRVRYRAGAPARDHDADPLHSSLVAGPVGAPPLTRLRRAFFGAVVLVAALGGVEGGLHAAIGNPPPSTHIQRVGQCEIDASGLVCSFDKRLSVPVGPRGQRPRVVFLGGSTVRRDHVPGSRDDFPTWVADSAPELEVINLGVAGYSTAGVWRLTTQLAPLKPDLVVIMTGHNDYNASVFDGSIRAITLRSLPFEVMLSRSWIHHWASPLRQLRDMRARASTLAIEDDFAIRTLSRVDERFRTELGQALDASPAPVVLTTLLRNWDCPPSGVHTPRDSACARHLASVQDDLARGGWRGVAAGTHEQCPGSSLDAFLRSHDAADPAARAEAWAESLQLDAAPLRAPLSADAILREEAGKRGVRVVDLAALEGGYQPLAWFTDAIHTTETGARVAAAEVLPAIRDALR